MNAGMDAVSIDVAVISGKRSPQCTGRGFDPRQDNCSDNQNGILFGILMLNQCYFNGASCIASLGK